MLSQYHCNPYALRHTPSWTSSTTHTLCSIETLASRKETKSLHILAIITGASGLTRSSLMPCKPLCNSEELTPDATKGCLLTCGRRSSANACSNHTLSHKTAWQLLWNIHCFLHCHAGVMSWRSTVFKCDDVTTMMLLSLGRSHHDIIIIIMITVTFYYDHL